MLFIPYIFDLPIRSFIFILRVCHGLMTDWLKIFFFNSPSNILFRNEKDLPVKKTAKICASWMASTWSFALVGSYLWFSSRKLLQGKEELSLSYWNSESFWELLIPSQWLTKTNLLKWLVMAWLIVYRNIQILSI